MKTLIAFIELVLLGSLNFSVLVAQKGDLFAPLEITVCDLGKAPEMYSGRLVSVRAWILPGKDLSITEPLKSRQCAYKIIVTLPETAHPKPEFELEKDDAFKRLQKALEERTHIEATLEGRFDSAVVFRDGKKVRVSKGFGREGRATMRLVLRRVSELDIRPTRSVDR